MSVNRTTPNCHLINPHRYRLARTVARKCKDDNESQRGMAKFDPRHPKPLNRSSPYFEHVMTSRKPTIVQSLIQIGYGVSIPHMRNFAHSNRLLWPHYGIKHAIIFSSCGFFFLLSSFFFFFFLVAYSEPSHIGCLPYFHTFEPILPQNRHSGIQFRRD